MELGNISQPVYSASLEEPSSSTVGLVHMVHGFLRLVQPHGLPLGACGGARGANLMPPFSLSQLLRYELGFLVCAAIGLLFAVLVPLVGCCFCCCRC
ncbi:PRM1A protein, partial [Odontophorus gujanensis]|nr:PRM1A protein [Odontophorus gujanensis]